MSQDIAKKTASLKALEFVKEGMQIGLGTGTTTFYFIQQLGHKCRNGLKILAVATSLDTEALAKKEGIPTLDANTLSHLDLAVDGADEIDPKKRLIKGAGGALVREKIIASMSKKMIVIADESKLVDKLGSKALPVEIIPFGLEATKKHLKDLGYKSYLRKKVDGTTYVTDNQNWILDVTLPALLEHPEQVHTDIANVVGVVETGFFFNLADQVIVGKPDGSVRIIS